MLISTGYDSLIWLKLLSAKASAKADLTSNSPTHSTILGKVTITVSLTEPYSGCGVLNFELMLIALGSADTSRPMLGVAMPERQAATLKAK